MNAESIIQEVLRNVRSENFARQESTTPNPDFPNDASSPVSTIGLTVTVTIECEIDINLNANL